MAMANRGEGLGGGARGGSSGSGSSKKVIKINSGNTKKTTPKKKTPSYSQLKDMPNLIKIDSNKGNSTKKIAYRKRTPN